MLADIIKAVLAEEEIMLKLAKGKLTEDKNGILRDSNGHYALENAEHHLSLAAYVRNPPLFNFIEKIAIASSPINTFRINSYLDSKKK
jgi:hypothetical protein